MSFEVGTPIPGSIRTKLMRTPEVDKLLGICALVRFVVWELRHWDEISKIQIVASFIPKRLRQLAQENCSRESLALISL